MNIKLPAWDYGPEANRKLKELFKTEDELDYFLDYMTQEMSIDTLVGFYLHHAPKEEIKAIANEIGTFDLEEYQ